MKRAAHRRRRVAGAALLGCLVVLALIAGLRAAPGRSDSSAPPVTVQSDLGVPFAPITFDGAPSAGQPGEVDANNETGFIRYTSAHGWQQLDAPIGPDGSPLGGFRMFGFEQPASNTSSVSGLAYPGAASVTPDGAMAAFGETCTLQNGQCTYGPWQVVVAERAGGVTQALPSPSALLSAGEVLARGSNQGGSPTLAAVDEAGGGSGVFVAPARNDGQAVDGILYWNGQQWTREPIDGANSLSGLTPLALKATSPGNAWLLAAGPASDPVLLFRRTGTGAGAHWAQMSLAGSPFGAGAQPTGVSIAPRSYPDTPLTVTSQGAWVDVTYGSAGAAPDATHGATFYVDAASGQVTGSWCDLQSLCANPLHEVWGNNTGTFGFQFGEDGYASIAFPGGKYGTRIVSNAQNGAYARFDGTSWQRILGTGESVGNSAAFYSIDDGWLGGAPPRRVTTTPAPDLTQLQPLPAQEPLLAAAPDPAQPVGSVNAQALAVGVNGTILRYQPGQGWNSESITDPGTGLRVTSTLRGVAWPTPDYAIAVGDGGAVYSWTASRGTWEADESKPGDLTENLTGVAFQPSNPDRGYIIGLDGTLLRYDKTLTQEQLPTSVAGENMISIAFAGSQAMVVAYNSTGYGPSRQVTCSLLVNSGSGWTVDQGLQALLAKTPGATITAVGGLPDGGAVVAGNDFVAYQDGPGQPWRADPAPPASGMAGELDLTAVSVAPFRDPDGTLRAMLDVTADDEGGIGYPDIRQVQAPSTPDEPAPQPQPALIPTSGWLLRGTATGWKDEQRTIYGVGAVGGETPADFTQYFPFQSDSILSLSLIGPDGSGWLVGGNSGRGDTAAIFRYPVTPGTAPVPSPEATSSVPLPSGPARFVFAGGAEESTAVVPNAHYAGDVMIQRAASVVNGLGSGAAAPRAVFYTGSSQYPGELFSTGFAAAGNDNPAALTREAAFGSLFSRPFYVAPSAGDSGANGSLSDFESAFATAPAPFGDGALPAGFSTSNVPAGASPAAGMARTHYALDTTGPAGTVRVIVVDLSAATGEPPASQENPIESQTAWTEAVLDDAKARGIPAIVVGNASLTDGVIAPGTVPTDQDIAGTDALSAFGKVLADHGASAYFFETALQNRVTYVPQGAPNAIPTYGTGSLNYGGLLGSATSGAVQHDLGGFLLAEVDAAHRNRATNVAPVKVRLIPVISQLTINPVDGTTVQRGAVALFQGLGRKPLAGYGSGQTPYTPFPRAQPCPASLGCPTSIAPEVRFASSDPDIGNFVATDPNSTNPRTPLLGADGTPVPSDTSGLFCAYNAGTTTVSIQAGGMSYSTKVTVTGGSPRRPCGTVPLNPARFPPAKAIVKVAQAPPVPGAAPNTPPASHHPTQPASPPLVPAPPAPPAPAPPPAPAHVSPPVISPPPTPASPPARAAPPPRAAPFVPPQVITPVVAVPPPNPTAARPIPPAGTAQVPVQVSAFANVPAAREERDEEVAPEDVQAASAYRPGSPAPMVPLVLGLVVIAAAAGGGLRRGRGGGREVRPVPITLDDRHRVRPMRRR